MANPDKSRPLHDYTAKSGYKFSTTIASKHATPTVFRGLPDTTKSWLWKLGLTQIFGKKRAIAKPAAFLIERREKQVTFLYRAKQFLARLRAGNGLTQRRAKPIEDRGPKHERK
jgi:hypothetical protein